MINDGYDDCIAYLDGQLGRLFEELDRRGLRRNTMVIVTADHGEHFGEHGLYGHASSLYDQEVHVPLLIDGPRNVPNGRSIDTPVTLRDIPATIVDLLGFASESHFPGRSLARHWSAEATTSELPSEPVLSEVDEPVKTAPNQGRSPVFRGAMKSVVVQGKAYIRNGDGVEELYDLASDPQEVHNLAGSTENQQVLETLRGELERLLKTEPPRNRSR
jgi:arylsulfatase A-like enzyme